MSNLKVFISYSWQPQEHKQRVIELAERLSSDGIHVILDVGYISSNRATHIGAKGATVSEQTMPVISEQTVPLA